MASVLVVDDDEDVLEYAEDTMRKSGLTVYCATSAEQGLELLEKNKIDAIVSDYVMPGISGMDFYREVCRRGGVQQFILISGKINDDDQVDTYLKEGVDQYYAKPFSFSEIAKFLIQQLK